MSGTRHTSLALLAAALLAAGCDTLPQGDPPVGDLADNTPPAATGATARRNLLVTQLSVYALGHAVRELYVEREPEVQAIARDAALVAGFVFREDAALRLAGCRGEDGVLELVISSADGRVVWRSAPAAPVARREP